MYRFISIFLCVLLLFGCSAPTNPQPSTESSTETIPASDATLKVQLVPHTLPELGYRFAYPHDVEGVNTYLPDVDMDVYELYNSYEYHEFNSIFEQQCQGSTCLFGEFISLQPQIDTSYLNGRNLFCFALIQAYFRADVEQENAYFRFNKTKDNVAVRKLSPKEAEPYLIYSDDTIMVYNFFSLTDAPSLESQLKDYPSENNFEIERYLKVRDYFSLEKLGKYIVKDNRYESFNKTISYSFDSAISMPTHGKTTMDTTFRTDSGLIIYLPYHWYGRYSVQSATVATVAEVDNTTRFDFKLGFDGPRLFSIYSFTNSDYENLTNSAKEQYGAYLGQNDMLSFTTVADNASNPFSPTSHDALLFNSMLYDSYYLKSFISIDSSSALNQRMPTEGIPSYWLTSDYDRTGFEQFAFPVDDTAKRLAEHIQHTFVFTNNPIYTDFEGRCEAPLDEMLATSLFHTPELIYSEYSDDRVNDAISAAKAVGVTADHLYYGEDVRAVASIIFDCDPKLKDNDNYLYCADQDMYVRLGDYGGPVFPYPQIVSYKKTNNGYTCDAIIVDALFECFILSKDSKGFFDIPISSKNIAFVAESQSQYRYTFEEVDGKLIFTGFARL